jgi:uncharacterized protein (TIGR03067 family)
VIARYNECLPNAADAFPPTEEGFDMTRNLLAGGVLALALGSLAFADEKALAELEGTYKVEALLKGGMDIPEEIRKNVSVKFKGEEMTLQLPEKALAAKIKVDASKTPKTIDISPSDGPEKGKTFPGIYKQDKGELVIAFSEKGDRPADFKAEGEVAVMKLKKE